MDSATILANGLADRIVADKGFVLTSTINTHDDEERCMHRIDRPEALEQGFYVLKPTRRQLGIRGLAFLLGIRRMPHTVVGRIEVACDGTVSAVAYGHDARHDVARIAQGVARNYGLGAPNVTSRDADHTPVTPCTCLDFTA